MNITTNNIGNYSLNTRTSQIGKNNRVNAEFTKTAEVSKSEKEFFTKLYPDNKSEIVDYHFYSNKGSMSGVSVGKNIDRKM